MRIDGVKPRLLKQPSELPRQGWPELAWMYFASKRPDLIVEVPRTVLQCTEVELHLRTVDGTHQLECSHLGAIPYHATEYVEHLKRPFRFHHLLSRFAMGHDSEKG